MQYIPTEPLLRFALMSLEHAVDHYRQGKDADRAFFILHLDHAVELVLKERLRGAGQSIVKRGGRTLSMGEVLDKLESCKVDVKERADLELLHEFRNQLQHTGATLDHHQMEHYAATTFPFFSRFLREELGVNINSVLEQYVLEELGRATRRFLEEQLYRDWEKVLSKIESDKPELAQELRRQRIRDATLLWIGSDQSTIYLVAIDDRYDSSENVKLLEEAIRQVVGFEFDVEFGDF